MISPSQYRSALQRVAAACHALLAGTVDVPVHQVSRAELSRMRRALTAGGLIISLADLRGGKGVHVLQSTSSGSDNGSTPEQKVLSNTERSEVRTTSPGLRPRTWLSDYCDAFRAVYKEPASPSAVKRMARTFKDLETGAPRSECVRRFTRYLHGTPKKFYSVERFGESWTAWKDEQSAGDWRKDATLQRPGENLDQYQGRLAAL